jgi:MarR family transcriptional regulator, organic hydroperoxide resistance regulator
MRVIEETPNCRVQDIAVALRITTGGTTQAVDRIVAAGYCNRRPNPADRRSSVIDLTEEGKSRLAAAASTLESELQARLGILPRRSINQLQEALKAIEK